MKLFIGICNSQHLIPSKFFWSIMTIKQVCPLTVFRAGHSWSIIRNNHLIRQFLDSDADVMIKMDVDQEYPTNYFEVMLPLAVKYKVIGPLIHDRWEQSGFMPLLFTDVKGTGQRLDDLTRYDLADKTGIIEIPFAHTNLFFTREVLEAIEPPWYDTGVTEDGLNKDSHTDFVFTRKIRDAGYKMYINLDVEVKHLTEMPVDRKFHEHYNRSNIG